MDLNAPEDRAPLEFTKADGSLKSRIEMEEEIRQKRKKLWSLRNLASYEYGLDKKYAYDMVPNVLRHWVLDEMIRRGLITGDLAGVNVPLYDDDNEKRQFIQRLTALIQTGQAVTPKTGEGIEIDMSNVPQPPGPPGYPPNGQNQPGAFVPPPPPGMAPPPQQGYAPPGPPQGGFQPPGPPQGGFAPPGPPQGAPQFAPQPGPQQGFAPPPQQQFAPPPGPPQQQQFAPQQGFAPPGVPPQQMPPQPMMPPGYAAPPGPPQGMPPGQSAAPQQQQAGGGGGRRRGGNKAADQQAAPPPAAPVPPMGAAPGFAPPPGPPQGQAPMPQQGGFQMPQQGFAPPPQQQFAPQPQQPAQGADTSALQAQVGELRGIILSLQRQVTIGNMAITILSRAVYQKQGSADIEAWLKELGVSVPQ